MTWAAERKSHEGLLAAGYFQHSYDGEHPKICKFCGREIVWYVSKNFKPQSFDVGTFEPHGATCSKWQEFRQKQREAREPGDETTQKYPD
jgi:hypothetical protein